VKVPAHLTRVAVDETRQLAALQVRPVEKRRQGPGRERVAVHVPAPPPVGFAPKVAQVSFDGRGIDAARWEGTRRAKTRQPVLTEPQPRGARPSWRAPLGEHALREGSGHADDVQVQIGRGLDKDMILARWPPEKVARRHRDGRFAVAEGGSAGRDQVELRLRVKMARPTRRRHVMPDVAARAARQRKRLVERLRHPLRLPEPQRSGRARCERARPLGRRRLNPA